MTKDLSSEAVEMFEVLLPLLRRNPRNYGVRKGIEQAIEHMSTKARKDAEVRIREAFCGVPNS